VSLENSLALKHFSPQLIFQLSLPRLPRVPVLTFNFTYANIGKLNHGVVGQYFEL